MTAPSPDPLERLRIRAPIEDYFAALDRHDSRAIAECFTADADISYFDGRKRFVGGDALAEYLRFLGNFEVVQHTIGSVWIDVDGGGSTARADTLAIAVLLDSSGGDSLPLKFRGVGYDDRLVRGPDGWRIRRRAHRGLWQHDTAPARQSVPHSS